MRNTLVSLVVISFVAGCVSSFRDNITETISSATSLNGKAVNVTGRLEIRHGLLNIYSLDHKQCIGLILDSDELSSLSPYVGSNVSLLGELVAKGCGSDIICDEHLCGPVNLREVEFREKLR